MSFPRHLRLLCFPLLLGAAIPAAAQDPPPFQFSFGSDVLNRPRSIAVNDTEVFVLEYSGREVSVFDLSGNFQRAWGSDGFADGQFKQPRQLTVTPAGYVYVTDDYRMDVQVFDLQGGFIRKWGGQGSADSLLDHPDGITYDESGNIWVADRTNNALKQFDAEGNHLFTLSGDTRLYGLTDMVVTPQYIYMTIWSGSFTGMRQWQRDGTYVGQSATVYQAPRGMDQAEGGNLYVVASGPSNRAYIVDPGTLGLLADWGGYGTADDQFGQPYDVAVAPSGAVYIADSDNNLVKVFAYTTEIEPTTWGKLKSHFR